MNRLRRTPTANTPPVLTEESVILLDDSSNEEINSRALPNTSSTRSGRKRTTKPSSFIFEASPPKVDRIIPGFVASRSSNASSTRSASTGAVSSSPNIFEAPRLRINSMMQVFGPSRLFHTSSTGSESSSNVDILPESLPSLAPISQTPGLSVTSSTSSIRQSFSSLASLPDVFNAFPESFATIVSRQRVRPVPSDISSTELSDDGNVIISNSDLKNFDSMSECNYLADTSDGESVEVNAPITFSKCFKCTQPKQTDSAKYCSLCWQNLTERRIQRSRKVKRKLYSKCGNNQSATCSSPKTPEANDNTSDLCIFCFTKKKNAAFVHGRNAHVCACYSCAITAWRNNIRCPLCNRKVGNVLKFYF